MRGAGGALRPLLTGLQTSNHACSQPTLAAWLQHLLSSSSRAMHTSSSSSSSSGNSSSSGRAQQPPPSQQQPPAADEQADAGYDYLFSIRPSALSPLHPYHREIRDEQERLTLLQHTLLAQVKLAEEVTPRELQIHGDSPNPVAAALAARRAALQAVRDSYVNLCDQHVFPRVVTPQDMGGYYALMESMLKNKDRDFKKYQEVVQGKQDVWSYWFEHFTKTYDGLPGLGSLESIYQQQDEEVVRQQLRKLQASSTDRPPRLPQVDQQGRAAAMGGRKTSIAQVFLWRGQGRVLVNRKPLDAYFSDLLMRSHVLKPLMTTGLVDQLDVLVHVQGGGISGQAQAAGHGIAKALVKLDPSLKPALKAARLLKRDPRAVERKKFGKAKARKGFAWVKR